MELAHAGGAVARARRFVLDGVRGLRLPCFLPHENERRERAARQKSAQRISAIMPKEGARSIDLSGRTQVLESKKKSKMEEMGWGCCGCVLLLTAVAVQQTCMLVTPRV